MPSARNRILEAGWALLTERGAAATSMDLVIDKAKVAKQTLYNHFPTKPELVEAVLHYGDTRLRAAVVEQVLARAPRPADRLQALFPVVKTAMAGLGYPGCTFLGAAVEDRFRPEVATAAAQRHKLALQAALEAWAHEAGATHPAKLAAQLLVLLNGALSTSLLERSGDAYDHAEAAAAVLIRAAS